MDNSNTVSRGLGPAVDLDILEPISTPYPYQDSFGSGTDNPNGLGLTFMNDHQNKRVVAVTTIDDRFAAYGKLLHGGIVITMLDEAMGWSVYGAKGILGVTQEISSRFNRPLFINKTYYIVGWISAHRDTYAETKAAILAKHGRVLAEASGKFLYKPSSRIDSYFNREKQSAKS